MSKSTKSRIDKTKKSLDEVQEKALKRIRAAFERELEEEEKKIREKQRELFDSLESPISQVNEIPIIDFESDAKGPIIRYDLPSPSSYEGKNIIELHDIKDEDFNAENAVTVKDLNQILNKNRDVIREFLTEMTKEELEEELFGLGIEAIEPPERPAIEDINRKITSREATINNLKTELGGIPKGWGWVFNFFRVIELTNRIRRNETILKVLQAKKVQIEADYDEEFPVKPVIPEGVDTFKARYQLFKYYLEIALRFKNLIPAFYKSMGNHLKIKFISIEELKPQLLSIETFKLTNFPGDYGAGTTIKTFSLLPREITEISIKSWKRTETTTKESSSILDSYTEEKADEFERGVQSENSRFSKMDKSSSYNVKASASARWGWGSASVSGGKEGSTKSSREESVKNVMNATAKHAQTASAKREVNINTEYEKKEEAEVETAIMRTIRNLNVTRTLNFTFRQMNQEFHSILHLTDLKLGFYNGFPGSLREYPLGDIGHFVDKYMSNPTDFIEVLKKMIMYEYGIIKDDQGNEIGGIFDHYGNNEALVEEFTPSGEETPYLRVKPPYDKEGNPYGQQKYIMRPEIRDENDKIIQQEDARYVNGVILGSNKITMKTDGVIVEALMGKVNALDDYSYLYRIEKIRKKRAENERIFQGLNLVNGLLKEKKYDEAVLAYKETFGVEPGIEVLKNLFSLKLETLKE